jgi:competence ComEA-like helix-hairpin-helix protein
MARRSDKERRFSAREARALLWLMPVLAVASWVVWEVAGAGETASTTLMSGDRAEPDSRRESLSLETPPTTTSPHPVGMRPDSEGRIPTGCGDPARADVSNDRVMPNGMTSGANPQLFIFDPNTIDYHDLMRLGFNRGEALGIIKFRERGKVFEIPEDFAACYQVSEAMYRRLAPYIVIGEGFRLKRWAKARDKGAPSEPSAKADGNDSAEFFSHRGLKPSEFGDQPVLVDLNTADSAALVAVSGIGGVTAARIVEYRARLGGFATVEQLAEVRGMTEQNYERILPQIFVDPTVIQKIDINFAPAKTLAQHPYIRAEALRKLLKTRQLKGGWRNFEELETDHIFETEELVRLRQYFVFN